MNLDSMRNSISQTIKRQGVRLMRATPTAIIIGLMGAALLPHVLPALQETAHTAPLAVALAGSLKLFGELGCSVISDFLLRFIERLRKKNKGGKTPSEEEVREQLEKELLKRWQAGGEEAIALRQEASKLLQTIQGIETALSAATGEVKQAIAQGLAELGGSFEEFRWILDELKDTLAEIRTKQALQLAMQKEQLGLQREQLVKTNMLLRLQQFSTPSPIPVSTDVIEVEEGISPADVPCPYKGLAAFEPEDAEYFFGREELIAELTARLAETRFLGVVGPSGSGKSSVVRAGLIPAIWRGELLGSGDWKTVVLTPGEHPLEELAIRVALLSGVAPGSLLSDLEKNERGLDLAVKQALTQEPEHVRLVLIVDQFEELFTLCRDENERHRFIKALLTAVQAQDSRLILVLAIRADFYGRCAAYPNLASKLQDNQVLVGPLSEDELRQAIERPAAQVGLSLEPGLVETILHDIAGAPGALPLLSHALLETWKRRRGHTLTLDGYTETGGVQGAIAKTADRIYDDTLSPGQQVIAHNIFLRLTAIGEGTEGTRRRVKRGELIPSAEDEPAVEAVLKTLIEARLITTSEDTIEVAHEALIRQWPKLQVWLEEDIEGLRIHRHLTGAAQEWERLNRDPGELYRGARLATASEWEEDHTHQLNALEKEFLEASQSLEVNELEAEREKTAQLRRRALYLTGALFMALVMTIVAIVLGQSARRSSAQADENAKQAQAASTLAVAGQATAQVASTQAVAEAEYRATAQSEAESQRLQAEEQRQIAFAHQLVAEAFSHYDDKYDLALLLSIEAFNTANTDQTRGNLLTTLEYRPELDRFIHTNSSGLSGMSFSPDGITLLSSSYGGDISFWDVKTGQSTGEKITLSEFGANCMALSINGEILAIGDDDGRVILWNIHTQRFLHQPLGTNQGWVNDVTFSPDGGIVASVVACGGYYPDGSCNQGGIYLWDVESGEPLYPPLYGHTEEIRSLAFSPDGKMLATSSDDNTIVLWNVASGKSIAEPLFGRWEWVYSVAFSSDGKWLAAGDSGGITLWDISNMNVFEQPIRQYLSQDNRHWINSLVFSPDSQTLATGDMYGNIRLYDVSGNFEPFGQVRIEYNSAHSGDVHLAFSPDGKILASSDDEGTIILWDLSGHQQLGNDPQSWISLACRKANRNFTHEEWDQYFPGELYRDTCSTFITAFIIATDFVESGWGYYEKEEFDKAIASFEQALEIDPDNIEAHEGLSSSYYYLGLYYEELEDYENAISTYEQALKVLPEDADICYLLGGAYYTLGNYDQAIYTYEQAMVYDPDGADSYYYMIGMSYYDWGKYEEAIVNFEKASSSNPERSDVYFWSGWSHFDMMNYEEAIENFGKYIELNDSYPEYGYVGIGRSYFQLGDYEQAIASFEQAVEFNPEYTSAYDGLGQSYYQMGEYQKAEENFFKIIEIYNDSVEAYDWVGWSYFDLGNYEKAIDYFEKYASIDPEDPDAFYSLGRAYYALEDYTQAGINFEQSLQLNSNDSLVYDWLGWSNYQSEDYEQGIANFEQAIALNPEYANAYNGIGWCYYKLEDYENAIASLEQAGAINPEYTNAYKGLGWAYYRTGDHEEAIKKFDKALEIDPEYADAYDGIGWAYYRLKDYPKAIEYFECALEIDSKYDDAYVGLAYAYYRFGEYQLAEDSFSKIVELNDYSPDGYDRVGWYYCEMGDYEKAIEYFEQIPTIDPTYKRAYSSIGWSYYRLENYTQAISSFDQAVAIDPEYAEAFDGIGWSYYRLKDYPKAIEYFEYALEIDSKHDDAYDGLAYTYYKLGEYQLAEDSFSKIIEIYDYSVDGYNWVGSDYYDLGDYEKAIEYFTKVLELDSENLDAYLGLGDTYFDWGRDEEALTQYQKYLDLIDEPLEYVVDRVEELSR